MKESIETLHLFPLLNDKLVAFLRSLSPGDWLHQTVARQWLVKDVASHLLDGNLRRIALHRDGWSLPPGREIGCYQDLVDFLNELNGDWVKATKRLSPAILVELLESTNRTVYSLFKEIDPLAPSIYPIGWAGETISTNRFDIAREYSERWLHQQQIRDALGDRELLTPEFYRPLLDIFMEAWTYTLRDTPAADGTVLKTTVTGQGGGQWWAIRREGKWEKGKQEDVATNKPRVETIIDGDVAWKLFSKSLRKEDVRGHITIEGEEALGEPVLQMISVMA